jgi:hypothetical protein
MSLANWSKGDDTTSDTARDVPCESSGRTSVGGWRWVAAGVAPAAISHPLEGPRPEVDGPASGFALASLYRLARASWLEGSPDG